MFDRVDVASALPCQPDSRGMQAPASFTAIPRVVIVVALVDLTVSIVPSGPAKLFKPAGAAQESLTIGRTRRSLAPAGVLRRQILTVALGRAAPNVHSNRAILGFCDVPSLQPFNRHADGKAPPRAATSMVDGAGLGRVVGRAIHR
ncbi:MAG: hypothetical protein AAGJ40_10535 [Planctomycetota bacterium]